MKTITRGLLPLAATCLVVPAYAHTLAREYSLEIERQPITAALTDLSRQTGLQIGYFPETFNENIFLGPLVGRYTAEAAIAQLLLPSGLTFERLNERTIAVTGPESTGSYSHAVFTVEQKTGHRSAPSLARLTDVRLAEGIAAEENNQQIGTAINTRESDGSKRRLSRNMEEVIVTAQKREERLRDVPVSISVLGGADLDRATFQGVAEALNRVPGVAAMDSHQGGSTILMVRGVSAAGGVFYGASPIAYYLDSVPFGFVGSAIVPDSSAYDMDRVEVLRGPQGTLYGASAQNGVVRVLTNDANLDKTQFKARTSASSTEGGRENFRGDVAVNVPIIDGKLAARAVVSYQKLGGWIDRPNENDANDGELKTFRLKVNAQPTDQLSIGLSSWLSRSDYDAPSQSNDDQRSSHQLEEPVSQDYDAFGLKVAYDFSKFSLTSSTSYLKYENGGVLDRSAFFVPPRPMPLFTGLTSKVLAEEVNLSSTHAGSWRWNIGGIYRDVEDRTFQTFGNLWPSPVDGTATSESFAVFGELTRIFLDGRFELTGGARYFDDRQTGTLDLRFIGINRTVKNDAEFDAVSPRVVLTWHPAKETTIYASYSEGFRSGQPAPALVRTSVPDFPQLEPDELKNYELGAKASLLNGRINIDTAVFYMDWQGVQQSLAVAINGQNYSSLLNGESASGVGVDFGVAAELVDGLTVGVNAGWNDLTMDADLITRPNQQTEVVLFKKGERIDNSPEWTVGASFAYAFPLGGAGFEGRFSASGNYVSERTYRSLNGATLYHTVGDPMLIAQTSFSVSAPEHWTMTLFVDNLNNEDGAILRDPGRDVNLSVRARPRTIGLQLEYGF